MLGQYFRLPTRTVPSRHQLLASLGCRSLTFDLRWSHDSGRDDDDDDEEDDDEEEEVEEEEVEDEDYDDDNVYLGDVAYLYEDSVDPEVLLILTWCEKIPRGQHSLLDLCADF